MLFSIRSTIKRWFFNILNKLFVNTYLDVKKEEKIKIKNLKASQQKSHLDNALKNRVINPKLQDQSNSIENVQIMEQLVDYSIHEASQTNIEQKNADLIPESQTIVQKFSEQPKKLLKNKNINSKQGKQEQSPLILPEFPQTLLLESEDLQFIRERQEKKEEREQEILQQDNQRKQEINNIIKKIDEVKRLPKEYAKDNQQKQQESESAVVQGNNQQLIPSQQNQEKKTKIQQKVKQLNQLPQQIILPPKKIEMSQVRIPLYKEEAFNKLNFDDPQGEGTWIEIDFKKIGKIPDNKQPEPEELIKEKSKKTRRDLLTEQDREELRIMDDRLHKDIQQRLKDIEQRTFLKALKSLNPIQQNDDIKSKKQNQTLEKVNNQSKESPYQPKKILNSDSSLSNYSIQTTMLPTHSEIGTQDHQQLEKYLYKNEAKIFQIKTSPQQLESSSANEKQQKNDPYVSTQINNEYDQYSPPIAQKDQNGSEISGKKNQNDKQNKNKVIKQDQMEIKQTQGPYQQKNQQSSKINKKYQKQGYLMEQINAEGQKPQLNQSTDIKSYHIQTNEGQNDHRQFQQKSEFFLRPVEPRINYTGRSTFGNVKTLKHNQTSQSVAQPEGKQSIYVVKTLDQQVDVKNDLSLKEPQQQMEIKCFEFIDSSQINTIQEEIIQDINIDNKEKLSFDSLVQILHKSADIIKPAYARFLGEFRKKRRILLTGDVTQYKDKIIEQMIFLESIKHQGTEFVCQTLRIDQNIYSNQFSAWMKDEEFDLIVRASHEDLEDSIKSKQTLMKANGIDILKEQINLINNNERFKQIQILHHEKQWQILGYAIEDLINLKYKIEKEDLIKFLSILFTKRLETYNSDKSIQSLKNQIEQRYLEIQQCEQLL